MFDRLGPDWSPEALASDTLAFTPTQAASLAKGWRDPPIDQIRELRWHKNLTAPSGKPGWLPGSWLGP
ncbi:hypothetical protein GCM10010433_27840 [Streptomyces pulveraceus]